MGSVSIITINRSNLDKKRIERLCAWIQTHIDTEITWDHLITQSVLNHMDLQRLFMFHQKTSPMQWIKFQREQLAQQARMTDASALMAKPAQAVPSTLTQH